MPQRKAKQRILPLEMEGTLWDQLSEEARGRCTTLLAQSLSAIVSAERKGNGREEQDERQVET